MNKTKIEWCDYTWNPVVGCKRGCPYCYAKRINDRFHIVDDFSNPHFFKHRLHEPRGVFKPSIIFVGSMTDIYYWQQNWIEEVIDMCNWCDRHTFMFLTKEPVIYYNYKWPLNCILGTTICSWKDIIREQILTLNDRKNQHFVSIEPLLGPFENYDWGGTDLIIIGAMTGPGAVKPKKEWINSIKHPNIFYKSNIKKYL